MTKKTLLVLLVSVCLTACLSLDNPELWLRASSIAQENWNWVPGKSIQISTTINSRNGKIVDSNELWLSHSISEENTVITEIIKSLENGTEVSIESAEKKWAEILKKDLTPTNEGFYFANIADLNLTKLDESKTISDKECTAYSFKYKSPDDGTEYSGKIWLDKATGAPMKRKFELADTPRFVTRIVVEEHYHFDESKGVWYTDHFRTVAYISALGRRMENETVINYSDHWEYSEK